MLVHATRNPLSMVRTSPGATSYRMMLPKLLSSRRPCPDADRMKKPAHGMLCRQLAVARHDQDVQHHDRLRGGMQSVMHTS